jgi:chromosome segregation ATPase
MAISGKRIILANNQALRAKDQNGEVQELLKLDESGIIAGKVKDYIDAQNGADMAAIVGIGSRVDNLEIEMPNKASAAMLAQEIQDRQSLQTNIYNDLGSEADARVAADSELSGRITSLEGSVPQKAEQSALEAEAVLRANGDQSLQSSITAVDGRVTSLDTSLVALDGRVYTAEQAIANLASSGAITELDGRLDVLEPKVSTLEGEMDQAQADLISLDGRMDSAEASLTSLDGYYQDIRDDLDQEISDRQSAVSAVEGRVTTLEARKKVECVKESAKTLSAQDISNGYIDLSAEAMSGSIHVFCERMAILEGLDYSVSVSGGVSRLTWTGPSASGGEEAFAEGDVVYVAFMKEVSYS